MDEADMGNKFANIFLKSALANQTAGAKSSGQSRTDCLDCGEDIPEDRRKAVAGCERCVACQTRHEEGMKRGS